MYESYEVIKLKKLIGELQSEFANPKTPDFVKRKIQERIMFLQNDILPNIQRNTMIIHSEISKYAVCAFEMATKYNCNMVVACFPIKSDYVNKPIVGVANPNELSRFNAPGTMQVYCKELEIINTDGNEVSFEPIKLTLSTELL